MKEEEVIEMEGEFEEVPEKPEETRVVKYSVTMAKIAELRERYKTVPEDLNIKENYEIVRKAKSHLTGLRSDVEKRRKELKADALAWGKLVDGTAKELIGALTEIEEPFANAKKEFDTAIEIAKREAALAEERRVDSIADRIARIKAMVEKNISSTAATIKAEMDALDQDDAAEWAMEFADKAKTTIQETKEKLFELFNMKHQQEMFAVQQAEAERVRKEEEEAARIQREKDIAEQEEKLAAERAAMAAERARLAEEQRVRDEAARAEQAERNRIQKEKDDAAAAEMARMKAEMEAMKRVQEEKEKPVPEVHEVKPEPVKADPTLSNTGAEFDYQSAGKAMIKFIGNREVTKNLLDAIINGSIPNIQFTGRK